MTNNRKSRYWGFIFYPKDKKTPKNWDEILQEYRIPIAVSPLHNKDKNPDGHRKKSHRHVIIPFGNTTTATIPQEISDSINGTLVIPIISIKGMYRYHLHLDNPEKCEYSDKDRILINGFNINDYAGMTSEEIYTMNIKIINYIEESNCLEYRELIHNLLGEDMELFMYARNNTLFFNTYITSRRNDLKKRFDK